MERKIGEIFKHNGEWYQCVVAMQGCRECSFRTQDYCTRHSECMSTERSDKTSVIFKKLEKVGEPFTCNYYGDNRLIMMQEYNLYNLDDVTNKDNIPMYINYKHKRIVIEIKQNKEDMEEGKLDPHMEKIIDGAFQNLSDEIRRQLNENLNKQRMKPFDLQKAKTGKPVCTRDGRKARIICFDKKGERPIIALVQNNNREDVYYYYNNGVNFINNTLSDNDLMMLPEKKEGWVNIVRGSDDRPHMGRGIFQSKEEAENAIKAFSDNLINTVKICWDE